MPTIEFTPETHTYTVDGKVMPSVSDIIAPLSDFSDISPATLEYAAARGIAVHSACEQLDYGIDLENIEELDPETAPYVGAYINWKRDFQIEVLHSEYMVHDSKYEFCGTVDRICRLYGRPDDPWIVDIKTTATYNYSNALKWHQQLWLYNKALADMEHTDYDPYAVAVLQLKKDGTYRFISEYELSNTILKKNPNYHPTRTMKALLDVYNAKKGRTLR